jgi:hypothetical protein
LVRRLSSVKAELVFSAELMSLHRTIVRPQSSSLQMRLLGHHGGGTRFKPTNHLTQQAVTHQWANNSEWVITRMFKNETELGTVAHSCQTRSWDAKIKMTAV